MDIDDEGGFSLHHKVTVHLHEWTSTHLGTDATAISTFDQGGLCISPAG